MAPRSEKHRPQDPPSFTTSGLKLSQVTLLSLDVRAWWWLIQFARPSRASAIPCTGLSQAISEHAAGRGNPSINLSAGRDVLSSYSGPVALTQSLQRNELNRRYLNKDKRSLWATR